MAVKIIRSSRRRKTIGTKIVGDKLLLYLHLPAGLTARGYLMASGLDRDEAELLKYK